MSTPQENFVMRHIEAPRAGPGHNFGDLSRFSDVCKPRHTISVTFHAWARRLNCGRNFGDLGAWIGTR